jgi:hypothetical protein
MDSYLIFICFKMTSFLSALLMMNYEQNTVEYTSFSSYTTLKNKEKAIILNQINSAVKLGSLRIQLQNIQV